MLSEFPNFKPIELSDKEEVEKITSKYPPYSDFNFVSMWSWDIKGQMRLSRLNDNLVVRFTDYITGKPFYSFLGNNKVNETARELLELSRKEKLKPLLKLVPELSAFQLDSAFGIVEDRDNFDYQYDIEKLVACQGKDFLTKRNLVNRFLKKYPDAVASICDLGNSHTLGQILQLSQLWEQNKIRNSSDAKVENESAALNRMLVVPKNFQLLTVGVYSGDQLICFCVNEILSQENAISHFAKANIASSGSYAFLMRENARLLKERGVKLLNYEQDLGIVNLRFSKESFRPTGFLKKMICTLK